MPKDKKKILTICQYHKGGDSGLPGLIKCVPFITMWWWYDFESLIQWMWVKTDFKWIPYICQAKDSLMAKKELHLN